MPVRQRVLALPIQLHLLLAAQPMLPTPVLQVVRRVITRHLLGRARLKEDEADSGTVTLIQRLWLCGQSQHAPALPGAERRVPTRHRRGCTGSLSA